MNNFCISTHVDRIRFAEHQKQSTIDVKFGLGNVGRHMERVGTEKWKVRVSIFHCIFMFKNKEKN